MEEQLESSMTEDFTPVALLNKPFLSPYEVRVLEQYVRLDNMRPDGINGPGKISLREIDLFLSYYPVDDVYYFIDLMQEIDRRHRNGIKASSSN